MRYFKTSIKTRVVCWEHHPLSVELAQLRPLHPMVEQDRPQPLLCSSPAQQCPWSPQLCPCSAQLTVHHTVQVWVLTLLHLGRNGFLLRPTERVLFICSLWLQKSLAHKAEVGENVLTQKKSYVCELLAACLLPFIRVFTINFIPQWPITVLFISFYCEAQRMLWTNPFWYSSAITAEESLSSLLRVPAQTHRSCLHPSIPALTPPHPALPSAVFEPTKLLLQLLLHLLTPASIP